jgi:hypothetical protein
MLGFYPYFVIRHNQDDSVVSFTRLLHFSPRELLGTGLLHEELSHLKFQRTPPGIKPVTFCLMAHFLNQLRHLPQNIDVTSQISENNLIYSSRGLLFTLAH